MRTSWRTRGSPNVLFLTSLATPITKEGNVRLKRRLADESGQAIIFTMLFLVVLLGAAALTIDVGGWYRQSRQAQAAADAAALAGAQALPADPSQAVTLAQQYGAANGGGTLSASVSTGLETDDTITVHVAQPAPLFFARVLDIGSVTAAADAAARAGVPSEVNSLSPIAVKTTSVAPFGRPVTLSISKNGAPGSFDIVDLNGGNNASTQIADWINNGYNGYLGLGTYPSDPGNNLSSQTQAALSNRLGTNILLPVYSSLTMNGGNAVYTIVGWAAFHLDSFTIHPKNSISGWFVSVEWDGINGSGSEPSDFGVHSISLVK